ncbi:snake venom 5'-nucleotidase-like [Saccoglossus kowalevskii]
MTVLHTNDYHQRFEPINKDGSTCSEIGEAQGECYGGIARLMTAVTEVRATHPNVLLVDAGDQFSGTAWFHVFNGAPSSYFMNSLEYDCMALGNHEFDNGIDGLIPFLNNVTFPVISANIDATYEPSIDGLYYPSTVLEIGGERIGLVGYTLDETAGSTTGNLIFTDEIEAVQAEVDILVNDGINKIIALGHSGYTKDMEIAEQVKGVDLVIGGHSHTLLYTGTPPAEEDEDIVEGPYPTMVTSSHDASVQVPVITAYKYGKYLGYLSMTFDDNGILTAYDGNPIILDSNVAQDEETQAEVEKWKSRLDAETCEIIGESYVYLDGRASSCRLEECNLGNLITDGAVYHYKKLDHRDVNMVIWNSDSIGDSIDKGNITVGDVMNALPYGDTLDLLELQGVYIREALEYAVSEYDGVTQQNRFLQMSGIRVTYDLTKPAYSRVSTADVVCTYCDIPESVPLDDNLVYKLICNDYLASGGGGYDMINDNKLSQITGADEIDVIVDYISTMTPMYTGIENRIIFAEETEECDVSASVKQNIATSALNLKFILDDFFSWNNIECFDDPDDVAGMWSYLLVTYLDKHSPLKQKRISQPRQSDW